MNLPEGMTEKELADTIQKVGKRLSRKFKFGFYTEQDIEQQVAVICLEALPDFDGKRPLENYLWSSAHNRLCNLKRDKYERRDKPCIKCPLYDPDLKCSTSQCEAFEDKTDCKMYANWIARNNAKKSLMNSVNVTMDASDEEDYQMDDEKMDKEKIFDIIDKNLPIHMRKDYIKFIHGFRLNKLKQQALIEEIKAICERNGIRE